MEMEEVPYEALVAKDKNCVTSAELREKAERVFEIQQKRYQGMEIRFNSQLKPGMMEEFCKMEDSAVKLLEKAFIKFRLSPRVYHRIIRVGRTVADMEGKEIISGEHISEAIRYRCIDDQYWSM